MRNLQNRPHDPDRDHTDGVSGSAVAEEGLVVRFRAPVIHWHWTVFVEGRGELCPNAVFAIERVTARAAVSRRFTTSRRHPPHSLQQNPHFRSGSDSLKKIQSP